MDRAGDFGSVCHGGVHPPTPPIILDNGSPSTKTGKTITEVRYSSVTDFRHDGRMDTEAIIAVEERRRDALTAFISEWAASQRDSLRYQDKYLKAFCDHVGIGYSTIRDYVIKNRGTTHSLSDKSYAKIAAAFPWATISMLKGEDQIPDRKLRALVEIYEEAEEGSPEKEALNLALRIRAQRQAQFDTQDEERRQSHRDQVAVADKKTRTNA